MLFDMEFGDSVFVLNMLIKHTTNERDGMAQSIRRNHIVLVSDEVHSVLHEIAEIGGTTPKELLESLFAAENMDQAGFILALLRGDYRAKFN